MKTAFFISACIFISTVSFAQKGYTVTGNISPAHNGEYIYLYPVDFSGLNPKTADSSLISDGRFRFTGKINTPGLLVSLHFKPAMKGICQFFLENRDINIRVAPTDAQNQLKDVIVSNSPVSDQYRQWKAMTEPYGINRYKLNMELDSLKKAGAAEDVITRLIAAADSLREQEKAAKISFIRSHPGYYISLLWFRSDIRHDKTIDPDSLHALYASLTPALRKTQEGQMLQQEIQTMQRLRTGHPAPDFRILDQKGKPVALRDFRGKYVLLDFWASWCGPCVQGIPELKEAYRRYKDQGLEIISISLDKDRQSWLNAIAKYDLPWVHVSELKYWDGEAHKRYNIYAIPQYILVDREGKLRGIDINLSQLPDLLK